MADALETFGQRFIFWKGQGTAVDPQGTLFFRRGGSFIRTVAKKESHRLFTFPGLVK